LIRNENLSFVCKDVHLLIERNDSPFTNAAATGDVIRIPIAHGEGRFTAPADMLAAIEDNGQVLYRYCNAQGAITAEANPNGSLNNIAGIVNAAGNVMGLMPHPERACEPLLGSADGLHVFHSLARQCNAMVA
jgi:phosphoribosylformylglycinamidine synthase